MPQPDVDQVLAINERQKAFYDGRHYRGRLSEIWLGLRNKVLFGLRNPDKVRTLGYEKHKGRFGFVSSKKVLDMDCLEANKPSVYVPKQSTDDVCINLWEKAIGVLRHRFYKKGFTKAGARAVCYLAPDFTEHDVVVDRGSTLVRQFPDMTKLVAKLTDRRKPECVIIGNNSAETRLPVKLARMAYRPFQNDVVRGGGHLTNIQFSF